MKITVSTGTDRYIDCEFDELRIEGKEVHNSRPLFDCPEDARLGRSLTGACQISEWMKMAYEAGKAGEPFEIEHVDLDGAET